MQSLPRVAYGPSPPLTDAKKTTRTGRSRGPKAPAANLGSDVAAAAPTASAHSAARTASSQCHRESRKLMEEYWQSVWQSRHDPPLYHTFSDRYGGTQGVPYASRQADAGAHAGRADGEGGLAVGGAVADVPACLTSATDAFREGRMSDAQTQLERALTILQNGAASQGVVTVEALTQLRGGSDADWQRSFWLGEVLRRLAVLELIRGHYVEAHKLLNGSIAADPLYSDTYLLRASCCEALRCFAEAYEDFAKYMKMAEPSLEVLAHSGKCAAEAGLAQVAREQLGRLLQLSEELLRSTAGVAAVASTQNAEQVNVLTSSNSTSLPPLTHPGWAAGTRTITPNCPSANATASLTHLELLRSACAFYVAHAHFYLGYVAETCTATEPSTRSPATQLRQATAAHYKAATRNTDYVQTYEESVARAMQVGDYALARHLLGYLQRMHPTRTSYFLDTATACRTEGDVQGELRALSAALDRAPSGLERRATLLARGAVYADQLHDWSRAIRDFTLLLTAAPSEPAQPMVDWSTPLALVRRASAYRHRQSDNSRTDVLRREDEAAALADYAAFLTALAVAVADAGIAPQDFVSAADAVPLLCRPQEVISALLVLANGAFHRQQYAHAVNYFSRAIALGWTPDMPTSVLPPSERLADQLYLSMAHHVMTLYPVGEDMFRVPYEAREAVSVSISATGASSGNEGRRPTKTSGGGPSARRNSSGEGDRLGFGSPPMLYTVVDQHYQRLRALEPTFFAAIEDAFLDLWEPYHSEVERLKEEAITSRAGRRGKR